MSGFNFNPESFVIGLGAGWGSALMVYRSRKRLKDISNAFRGRPSEADVAIKGADSRYLTDLVAHCQHSHLAGTRVSLSDVLVEPRFIPAEPVAVPLEAEDLVRSVFHVIPITPDLPYLHAYYNVPTIAIEELDNGHNGVAILGQQGSGRTTALHAIALWILGQVDFRPPPDPVQIRLQAENDELNDEQRAQRLQQWQQVEQMARQSLAHKRGEDEEDEDDQPVVTRTLLKGLTPIYVHCGNIITGSREYGRQVDPAEPIVRAAQHYARGLTRKTMPRGLYKRIEQGKAVLLIDGFDDLPENERLIKLEWLRALRETYPNTFTIVTGPASGFGPLADAGFAPVFLRPFSDINARRLSDRWAEAWTQISTERRPIEPHEDIIDLAKEDSRARTPFELTLKTWKTFEDPEQTGYEDWIQRAIARHLPKDPLEDILPKLQELATLQLEEGFITVKRLEEVALQRQLSGMGTALDEAEVVAETDPDDNERDSADDFLASLDTVRDEADDEAADLQALMDEVAGEDEEAQAAPVVAAEDVDEDEKEIKPDSRIGREYAQLVRKLFDAGLLTHYRGNRYQFRHPLVADYIASLAVAEMSEQEREQAVYKPAWNRALMYSALHSDVTDLVSLRLDAPADVLHTNVLDTTRWLAYLEDRQEWRGELLRLLGNMFVSPTQYRLTRERVAAALAGSRDRGVLKIFQTAFSHPKPIVRQLAVLGAGALANDEAVGAMANLLEDEEIDVKLAAGLALGAVGSEEAMEEMVVAFTQPDEKLQQAIAEAFAAIPDEGYPILYDAIKHDDMALRRAAVFGLRRIPTNWALITLYQTSMEDPQWYVRNAAEMAFSGMEFGDTAGGPELHRQPDEIPWLRDWILSLGEMVVQTTTPDDFLKKAMEEGREQFVELAAINIGRLGRVSDVGLLYKALRHRSSAIREASHRGLSELQLQMGQPLPAPV